MCGCMSLKEQYKIHISILADKLLNVSREYNIPIRDVANTAVFKAVERKRYHIEHQSRLTKFILDERGE